MSRHTSAPTWEDIPLLAEAETIRVYWSGPHGTDELGVPRYTLGVVVRCPFCRREHNHGTGRGYGEDIPAILSRVAHCAGRYADAHPTGTYWITGADRADIPSYPGERARQIAQRRQEADT
ncbi:hypothetical protein [Nesterenkonia xinjiangensis]|uniref:Uncharacterized protein n=1 Tax=Nesterenkonia xinjiangensis TaxID=225327 RepID=A0A7Z0GNI1_9MICC|nr:hypothetical protein [Nesterenkonia xinjiangensis]NYJ79182.1 hypothetical protein [Nesterenkonia xinjiangensis]